jgi:hypothetical protein
MWEPNYWLKYQATNAGAAGYDVAKAFDGNLATYYNQTKAATGALTYVFDSPGHTVTSYKIGTAPSTPTADPKSWTLEGSNDGTNFTVLDTRSSQTFAARSTFYTYTVANPMPFHMVRLNVSANNGASKQLQVGDVQFTEACVAESDAAFCSRLALNCGSVWQFDNCGNLRTVASCGTCAGADSCGGGGTSNICGHGIVDDATVGTGDSQFNYVGSGWSHCNNCGDYYNLSNSWSNVANDSVTMSFTGTQVSFYGVKNSSHGIGALSVDGGAETMVDFYDPTAIGNVLMWTSPTLLPGPHTFKIRVPHTKNASSTDYFVVPDRITYQ